MQVYSFAEVVQISLLDLWGRIVSILPDLIGAVVIIFLGLLVAPILGGIARRLIDVLKIDPLAEKMGLHDMMSGYSKRFSISRIIGKLVKWFFILAFVMAAAEVMNWDRVTEFLNEIIFYIPNVLIAIIILVFGVIAGKFFEVIVTKALQGAETPVNNPDVLGKITRWSFIVFAALAALLQLGIAPSLIEILFGGLVLALALAFGLGGRDHASKLLSHIYSKK